MSKLIDARVVTVNDGKSIVKFEASSTESSILDIWGNQIVGFRFPVNFTNGQITFKSAIRAKDEFLFMRDVLGNLLSIQGESSSQICFSPNFLLGSQNLKLVCSIPQIELVEVEIVLMPIIG